MSILFDSAVHIRSATDGPITLTTVDGTVTLHIHTGDPNSNVTANQGSLCLDNSATGTVWKKETGTGNTGWVELGTGGGGGGATYDEVAAKANIDDATINESFHLRKVLTNHVTYMRFNSAWQIFAMHSTGSDAAFNTMNTTPADLEIGQHFTSLTSGDTVVWRGTGTGWVDEGPR